jgi:hypothetical protein
VTSIATIGLKLMSQTQVTRVTDKGFQRGVNGSSLNRAEIVESKELLDEHSHKDKGFNPY